MAYYTAYELTVHEGDVDLLEVKKWFDNLDEDLMEFRFDCLKSYGRIRWYDHDEDCAEMSRHFPGVVFRLSGIGSDPRDIWDSYYKDGLCQICRTTIIYPPYDEKKLKPVHEAQKEDEDSVNGLFVA